MKPTSPTVIDPNAPHATPVDDGTMDRTRWEPNAAQLEAFKAREVQMCIDAIERDRILIPSHTLFAHQTWETAKRILKETGRLVA